MLIPVSENLAIIPYFLRSLRISKMFEAREKYCTEDKIPRQDVKKWSELTLILFMVGWIIFCCVAEIIMFMTGNSYTMFLSIDGILDDEGYFEDETSNMHVVSAGCFILVFQYFWTTLLLLMALYY